MSRFSTAFKAYASVLIGILFLTCMDTLIKTVTATHSVGQILFLRYCCGAPFAIAYFWWMKPGGFSAEMLKAHAMRSVIIVVTAGQFFYALSVLPLAEAIALTFLAPLFLALLAGLMLKEHVGAGVFVAIGIGLVGVIVIASGHITPGGMAATPVLGIAAAIGCACTYALNLIYLRQRAQKDPLSIIVLLQHVLPLVLTLPFAVMFWVSPTPLQWLTYLGIGFFGVCGHLSFAYGYSRASAGPLGVLEYSSLIWGAALGYIFFAEVPGVRTFLGSGFIIAACIWAASTAGRKPA